MTVASNWSAEFFGAAAALGFGAAAFLLARALYPVAFVRAVNDRREKMREDLARSPGRQSGPRRLLLLGPRYFRLVADVLADGLAGLAQPLVREQWALRMRRRFMALGRPEYEPRDFRARQLVFAVLFGAFGLVMLQLLGRSWLAKVLLALALGTGGFFFPYLWLRDQIARRHKAINRTLPYHLDLMTLSLEAGLDFAQGLVTVVERGQPGPLLEELSILVSEMKLGKTREEGLRNMGDRVQLSEITSFTSTLIQADKMGTSLGKVLRIQSGQLRVMRAQAAEKAANEAPVKMLLPLVLCFFPTMFIILFGPIVYRMMYGG